MVKTNRVFSVLFISVVLFSFSFDSNLKQNTKTHIEVGQVLFPQNKEEISRCFSTYQNDLEEFSKTFSILIDEYEIEPKVSSLTELLFSYGQWKNKTVYLDWKGEENEGELEGLIDEITGKELLFPITQEFRSNSKQTEKRDGKYIVKLFEALDKDLKSEELSLVFFNIDWDAYGFTVIPIDDFEKISKIDNQILKRL